MTILDFVKALTTTQSAIDKPQNQLYYFYNEHMIIIAQMFIYRVAILPVLLVRSPWPEKPNRLICTC